MWNLEAFVNQSLLRALKKPTKGKGLSVVRILKLNIDMFLAMWLKKLVNMKFTEELSNTLRL